MPWEREDTERWLKDYPLPPDFVWNGEKVWPRYQLQHGYGQWLATAGSYHPALRGLFALIHDILAEKSATGARAPTPDELASELRAYATLQGTLGIEVEEIPKPAAPAAGEWKGVDFAQKLRAKQAGDNPTTA